MELEKEETIAIGGTMDKESQKRTSLAGYLPKDDVTMAKNVGLVTIASRRPRPPNPSQPQPSKKHGQGRSTESGDVASNASLIPDQDSKCEP